MSRVVKQVLAVVLLCTVAAVMYPSLGSAQQIDGTRVPGVLVVKFAEGVVPVYTAGRSGEESMGLADVDAINSQYGLQSFRRLFPSVGEPEPPRQGSALARYHILQFPGDIDLDALAAEYLSSPNVEHVEFDYYAHMHAIPDDPRFTNMWNLSQTSDHDVDADLAWDVTSGSPAIVLGVTDTGVLYDHEDLDDNIWVNPGEDLDGDGEVYDPDDMNGIDDDGNGYVDDVIGWDFVVSGYEPGDYPVIPGEDALDPDNDPKDFQGHGTHTSGTVAATTNNTTGVSGLAGGFGAGSPGCKIMCLRMGWAIEFFGGETGITKMSYVAEAFVYGADMGARAINYSFGSGSGGGIEAATDYAVANGVAICASAGNSNSSGGFGYLQSRSDVITIAATDEGDGKSSFSNYGPLVDISAPGSNIWSTVSNHYTPGYASYNGTSMASPHVVGLIGLMLSVNPGLTRTELLDIMSLTADPTTNYIGQMGAGRINAYQSVLESSAFRISHTPYPNTADTLNPYTILATIVSDTALLTDSLSLFYRTSADTGSSFTRMSLTATGNPDEYSADIPSQPAGSTVEYGLTAEDQSGERVVSPSGFPGFVHSFDVLGTPVLAYYPGLFDVELTSGYQTTEYLTIRNDGNDDLEFDVTPAASPLLSVNPTSASVLQGDSIMVEVLFDATPIHQDTTFNYTINLTADDSVGSDIDIPVTMHVLAPDYYVEVDPEFDSQIKAAEDTIFYNVVLTNYGAMDDQYDLIISDANWPTEVWDSGMTSVITQTPVLSQNDQSTIHPRVIIPAGELYGTADTCIITVQSLGDTAISRTFTGLSVSAGQPDSIPWKDQFLTTTLDPLHWREIQNAEVNDIGIDEPSPPYSLNLNGSPSGNDMVESVPINLSGQVQVALSYWYQRTGGGEDVDSGEDLIFEFKNSSDMWEEISRQPGNGPSMTTYEQVEVFLPSSAFHADFRLRIRSIGTAGPYDDWFVDDVLIYAPIPPSVCYDPAAFSFEMVENDSTYDTLVVCNDGPGELRFSLSQSVPDGVMSISDLLGAPPVHDESQSLTIDQGTPPATSPYPASAFAQLTGTVQIMAWIPYADQFQEYPNMLNALSAYFTDYTLTESYALDPVSVEGALVGQDILLIPEQEGAPDLFSIGEDLASVLQDFVAGGGGIVACDGTGAAVSSFLRGAGVLDATGGTYLSLESFETIGQHPVTTGIEGIHSSQNATRVINHTDGETVMARTATGEPVVVVKDDMGGRVVLFGWDFYDYVDFMARSLANAVEWAAGQAWLSYTPRSDTIAPGDSSYVTLTVNTSSIGSGDYQKLIGIHSNDPYTPLVEIPVDLRLRGPEIDVSPTSVVDTVVEGIDRAAFLWAYNIGEEPLTIDSVRGAVVWLTSAFPTTVIAPGDSAEIEVTIGDVSLYPGDHQGDVHIFSSDYDEPVFAVPFDIHVGPDPDIGVDPESLMVVIAKDDTTSASFTIDNFGDGTLTYSTAITYTPLADDVVDPPSYPSEYYDPMTKGDTDTRAGHPVVHGAGGPDSAGYRWIDSDEPGGPSFDWVDVSGIGTPVAGLSDDSFVGPFSIGFDFPYYDSAYSEFYIGSNGFIGFGPTAGYYSLSNTPLPSAGTPNNIIAWCWDDLYPDGHVYYHSDGNRLVIQFNSYGQYYTPGHITAEIILYKNGRVLMQYQDITGGFNTTSSTVGIESRTGTIGLASAFNTSYIQTDLAVLFSQTPAWLSVSPDSGTVPPHSNVPLLAHINGLGLTQPEYRAEIMMSSNDPDEDSVAVPVRVEVLLPEIAVRLDSMSLEGEEGVSTDSLFWIVNEGEATLLYAILADQSWLTLLPDSGEVPPFDSVAIGLKANATSLLPGDYGATVTIGSNDVDEPVTFLPIAFHVGPDPDIWVSPDTLDVVMDPDDSLHQTLLIGNAGEGTLAFQTAILPATAPMGLYDDSKIAGLPDYGVLDPVADYGLSGSESIAGDTLPLTSYIPVPAPVAGITFGLDGSLHAAAPSPDVIYRMDSPGSWSVYSSEVSNPYGIAFNAQGGLAVANMSTRQILMIHPDGSSEVLADLSVTPAGLAYGPEGILYVTTDNSRVVTVSPSGDVELFTGTVPPTTFDAAFGPDGRLYVSTFSDGRVLAIDPDGTVSTYANLGAYLEGLAFDIEGNLYVGNGYYGTVTRINADQTVDVIGTGYPGPLHLALDEDGLLHIGSIARSRIDTLRVGVPGVRLPYGSAWMWLMAEDGTLAGTFFADSIEGQHAQAMLAGFSSYHLTGTDYYAQLLLSSNDPAEESLLVPVHMHLRSPIAVVRTDSMWMEVNETQTSDSTLWVINDGDASLDVSLSAADAWLTPSPAAQTIAAQDSVGFAITADATTLLAGTYSSSVEISTSDVNHPGFTVAVHLDVGPDPDIELVPESLVVELDEGDSLVSIIDINNIGDGTLWYTATLEIDETTLRIESPEPYPDGYETAPGKDEPDPRTGRPVTNGFGGPDSAGYRWIDSDEPDGPVFDWIDVSEVGTVVTGLADDNYVGPFPIGFEFPYYDSTYTEFYIASNGFIGFGPSNRYGWPGNGPIPMRNTPNNFIAWCWDDLYPSNHVYYYSDGTRCVIQFTEFRQYNSAGVITAELILHKNGQAVIQYLSISNEFQTVFSTIGIENRTGFIGLETAFNTSYIYDSLAIRYSPFHNWITMTPGADTMPPHNTEAMTVHLKTDVFSDDYRADIVFRTNDPVDDSIRLPVLLRTLRPDITLRPAAVTMDALEGGLSDSSLWILNEGQVALSFEMTPSQPWLSVSPTRGIVAAQDSNEIIVTSNAALLLPGPYGARLSVFSNDSDEPDIVIPVTLRVGPDPDVEILPDSLSVSLNQGESTDAEILVHNRGSGTLSFAVHVQDSSRSIPSLWSTIVSDVVTDGLVSSTPVHSEPTAGASFGDTPLSDVRYALLQESNPWDSQQLRDLLAAHGIAYDILETSQMGIVDLNIYDKVITSSAQSSSFWLELSSHRQWLEEYVAAGGTLELHLASFSSDNVTGLPMPGGFTVGSTAGMERVSMVDSAHPIVTIPNVITDAELDYWGYSTHGFLQTIPPEANTILRSTASGDPVCIELSIGLGRLLATTQTVEWPGASLPYLENLVLYIRDTPSWVQATPKRGEVPPDEHSTLTLSLCTDGQVDDELFGQLTLAANDPDEELSTVPLHVSILRPQIAIRPTIIEIDVLEGESAHTDLWVINDGASALTLEAFGDQSWLGVLPVHETVPAMDSARLVVIGDATELLPGNHKANLTITTNDIDNPTIMIPITLDVGPDPDIHVSSDSLFFRLTSVDTTTELLTIENLGQGTLAFDTWVNRHAVMSAPFRATYPAWHYDDIPREEPDTRIGEPVTQGSGGPDSAGYSWIDSDAPDGPTFVWDDISSSGTPVTPLVPDGYNGPYSIGFDFPYYDTVFSEFWVSTKGFIGFGPSIAYQARTNKPLPTSTSPNNIICWYWDDLFPSSGDNPTTVHYKSEADRLIVQFTRYRHWTAPSGPWITGQIALHRNGVIHLYTLEVQSGFYVNSQTVGIENQDGSDGLEVAYNTAYTHDEQAIRISRIPRWLSIFPHNGQIPGEASANLDVSVNTADLLDTVHFAEIVVSSNDPDESWTIVPVHLSVQFPDSELRRSVIQMDAEEGLSSNSALWLINSGDAPLRFTVQGDQPWLSVSPDSATVPVADSIALTVTADAASLIPGEYSGSLVVISNDPNEPSLTIPVVLDVGPDPDIDIRPDSLAFSLSRGDSANMIIIIDNSGPGTLAFDVSVERGVVPSVGTRDPYPDWYYDSIPKDDFDTRIGAPVTQGFGGPDSAGYRWVDSDELDGPAFQWTDIAGTSTQVNGLDDDNWLGPLPIGFAFPYYDSIYTDLYICSNGYIGFGPPDRYYDRSNDPIPWFLAPNNILAWFWTDLDVYTGSNPTTVWYESQPSQLTIQFDKARRHMAGGDWITAQVILSDNGSILLQYKEIQPGFNTELGTVGMENALGDIGLEISFNTDYLHDSLTIRIAQTPAWLSVSPAGGLVPGNTDSSLAVEVQTSQLAAGDYLADILILSNDPDEPTVRIPVSLRVTSVFGECVSSHQGDMDADADIDAVDMNLLINAVFFGGLNPQDNGCPTTRGDFNADGITDAIDMNLLISYVFFSGAGPCNPCEPISMSCGP